MTCSLRIHCRSNIAHMQYTVKWQNLPAWVSLLRLKKEVVCEYDVSMTSCCDTIFRISFSFYQLVFTWNILVDENEKLHPLWSINFRNVWLLSVWFQSTIIVGRKFFHYQFSYLSFLKVNIWLSSSLVNRWTISVISNVEENMSCQKEKIITV